MPRKHALLSASASTRWLNCTPSAILESRVKHTSSTYADEGTTAHALAEAELNYYFGYTDKTAYRNALKTIEADEHYNNSMQEYVNDYVIFVVERFNVYKKALIFFEQRLDLSDYVPDGFGTSDVTLLTPSTLEIIDLKYGAGVRVNAESNKQLMLYALGAYLEFNYIHEPIDIKITVYQPRINNFDSWAITVNELLAWAEDELKPKAQQAFNGQGKLTPGDWCKFCKVKATCRALAERALELARLDFADVKQSKEPVRKEYLTDSEISVILNNTAMLKNWLTGIEAYALDAAVNHGKKWPGMKLVEGRSTRRFSDAEKVQALLLKKYDEDEVLEKKLIALTKLEKTLTPKVFNKLLNRFIVKPPGALTLVPENDKRDEYNSLKSAQKDFL